MSENKNIKDKNGLNKMRELFNGNRTLMLATALGNIPFSVCPMTLQQIDKHGDLWFFSSEDSGHFNDIKEDDKVQLLYSDEPNQKYISMFGKARHIIDIQKINELWSKELDTWFDGKKDPNLALLQVKIENAFYWDSSGNKLVSFFE